METLLSLLLGLGLPAALAWIAKSTLNLPMLWVWLMALNLTLFALMGKDKFAAVNKTRRTPELTLLLLTFLGGTPAFFLGRKLFHHKRNKESFNAALYAVIGAQLFCIWWFWRDLRGWM